MGGAWHAKRAAREACATSSRRAIDTAQPLSHPSLKTYAIISLQLPLLMAAIKISQARDVSPYCGIFFLMLLKNSSKILLIVVTLPFFLYLKIL